MIEPIKYVLAGGVNTALTYLIYLTALTITPYVAAYTIAYIGGVVISYYLNTMFVFHEKPTWRKAIAFPLVYVVQYFSGVLLLVVFAKWFKIPETYAPLAVIIVTLPLTFYLSRWIIRNDRLGKDIFSRTCITTPTIDQQLPKSNGNKDEF